jgi:glycosyltransferase 2 family protein
MPPASKTVSIPQRLSIGLLLGFAVVIALLLWSDLSQVSQTVLAFPWDLYPLVLGLTLVNYALRFGKWHYYLGQIGVRLPVSTSARLFVGGFPLAVTPGKVGEALKAVWLRGQTGAPVARGVAVVLAERISDGLAVLGLSTLGVIAYPRYWPAFAIAGGGLLTIVALSQMRPLALALLRMGEKLPVVARIARPLGEFYEGSFLLFRPRATLAAVSLGMVSWLAESLGLYLILLGLGVPASLENLAIAVFIMSFSMVVGAVSTLPGGLGAAEASIAGMLTLLLHLPPAQAATATLLIRFATLWFGVSLGLLTWATSRSLFTWQEAGKLRSSGEWANSP